MTPLADKTLVVWAAPSIHTPHGGSALTIEDGSAHFDAVVFGEIAPRRWMAGSDSHHRSYLQQDAWVEETVGADGFVQIAIAYSGRDVSIYRNGALYARYTMENEPQPFSDRAHVLFGKRHLDVDSGQSFVGRIADARIYDCALEAADIGALKMGAEGPKKPWAWWDFARGGLREKNGRFSRIDLLGTARIEDGALLLEDAEATLVCSHAAEQGWRAEDPVPSVAVQMARSLRESLLADPHRPRYHFCLPDDMGEPGDPNGAFFHGGRYHLMYLYKRTGSGFCWGHVSSSDLLHWRHHPDAIGPGDGDEGCFSGGAFVDEDGTVTLSYWMLWGAKGIGLATSRDADLITWEKSPANPVIPSTEWGLTEVRDADGNAHFYGSADPSNIWKKDGRYYMLTGNLLVLNKVGREDDAPLSQQGDRLYLFVSDDLQHWDYLHVFYKRDPRWTDRSEDNMCPSFLPLPSSAEGGQPSDKHLLLFISHNMGCQYYIGDYRDDRFYPDHHGRMTWIDNTYFAPEALIDDRGRHIMWAWLLDNPPQQRERGWSGVYGLPRSLWLGADGTLRMAPVSELTALRGPLLEWHDVVLDDDLIQPISGIDETCCEIEVEVEIEQATRCGLRVRASADGSEETLIYADLERGELVLDTSRSGPVGRTVIERAPLSLAQGEPLHLRVFIDRSVIEVFANERQAIGRRVYPLHRNSTATSLWVQGGSAQLRRMRAWTMAPSNPH